MFVISGSSGPAISELKALLSLIEDPKKISAEIENIESLIKDLNDLVARNEAALASAKEIEAKNAADKIANDLERKVLAGLKASLAEKEKSSDAMFLECKSALKKVEIDRSESEAEVAGAMAEVKAREEKASGLMDAAKSAMAEANDLKAEYEEKLAKLKAAMGV